MQPSAHQSNDEQQNNTSVSTTSTTNDTERVDCAPSALATTSISLSPPPRTQPAASSLPMYQNMSNFPSQFDRERSTLRLADLEPWMDDQYAHRLAEVMEWPPAHIHIPSPPPDATVSSNASPDDYTAPSAARRRNPGHLFITFRSAADAASVLAQLHITNATQSRAGLAPVRLPSSERIVDLTYASREDCLKWWDHHFHSNDSQVTGSNLSSAGRTGETNPSFEESTPAQSRSGHTPKRPSTPSVSPQPIGPPGPKLSTVVTSSESGVSSQLTNHPPSQRGTGEYSIFVGDLAPDVTHADIIAVFRDPTKGLRPDRGPPRKIKPFTSCKTAKIMVDPSTGLSRGYGFIRFTDEADQRRALIEMQGLYCLSRPMRLSHATAKGKGVPASGPGDVGSLLDRGDQELARSLPSSSPGLEATFQTSFPVATGSQHRSASSPSTLAILGESGGGNVKPNPLASSANPGPHSSRPQSTASDLVPTTSDRTNPSMSSTDGGAAIRAVTIQDVPPWLIVQIANLARNGTLLEYLLQHGCSDAAEALSRSSSSGVEKDKAKDRNPPLQQSLSQTRSTPSNDGAGAGAGVRPSTLDDSKLDEGARDLLSVLTENIAGSSGDPYNTTVFVGGLSSLIPEDTLRSFFAPFGDIHYVKIPPGKGCGFVQFVHKADAARAMEHMQGFAIGGSKIRLSWGRSQYRAAVAAAQATQLGINMGELQNFADANSGTFPPTLLARTPSPRVGGVGPIQEPNRDIPSLKDDRDSEPFSVVAIPSSIALSRHSEVLGREHDFTDNYTRRPIQLSPTAPGHFAPFSPDLGPRRMSSPSAYGSAPIESGGPRGGSFGHLRESRTFDPGMGELPVHRIGLDMDTTHRHAELSLEEFHHVQPHEQLRGSMQSSQVHGLTALQLQQHNAPRFGRSSPFGSSLEGDMYNELAQDDFVVRSGLYGGAPMNRVPTYRRDYGSPSPASGWQGH